MSEPTEEELAEWWDCTVAAQPRRVRDGDIRRLIEALRSSRARVEELEALLNSATQECVTSAQRIEELERATGEYVEVRRVINKNSGSGSKWDHREARRWADKSAAAFEALRQALHHTPKDGTHS